jgi:hypothetical protein
MGSLPELTDADNCKKPAGWKSLLNDPWASWLRWFIGSVAIVMLVPIFVAHLENSRQKRAQQIAAFQEFSSSLNTYHVAEQRMQWMVVAQDCGALAVTMGIQKIPIQFDTEMMLDYHWATQMALVQLGAAVDRANVVFEGFPSTLFEKLATAMNAPGPYSRLSEKELRAQIATMREQYDGEQICGEVAWWSLSSNPSPIWTAGRELRDAAVARLAGFSNETLDDPGSYYSWHPRVQSSQEE